jgi:hypothetical protein
MMIDLCDLELIGQRLEQEGLVVNLTKEYYQQDVVELDRAQELLRNCDIANLVGDKIVGHAISMKMAKEVSIKRISGVPFLMIYKFRHS